MNSYQKGALLFFTVIIVGWFVTSLSPDLVIRRYILFMGHPVRAVTALIPDSTRNDPKYGHLFLPSEGYREQAAGGEMDVFYLKKFGIIWAVASVGTAP
ncbi:hypothetical protein [Paenibacillus gansuensis]|uniref:Uncharacterized protein n=1 Tax=Paenibacillus gansuensis TaxID=306542 RepID=A0ABW5PB54_9BACL